ncbi:MAG: metallophosphoesterase [Anaerostipes sp.]|nr:metallophosphoesterase [Anaerostipes sp.]
MIALLLAPIYLLVNYYLVCRSISWMGACTKHFKKKKIRIAYVILYSFASLSLLIAFILPQSRIQRFFKIVSNYWIGMFFYIVFFAAVGDLVRITIMKRRGMKKGETISKGLFVTVGTCIAVGVIAFSVYGSLHARHIYKTKYRITVNKKTKTKQLKVVLIADLHLGYSIGNEHMKEMVDKINQMNPDIVCVAGDVFDNDIRAIKNIDETADTLSQIQSKYGTYVSWGNHDLDEKILAGFTFGGRKKSADTPMMKFFRKSNMKLLSDQGVLINDEFYLVGRQDAERARKVTNGRKTPKELLKNLDSSKPILVMDHEPSELGELARSGADVDLSGHTHDGQMFPANILTSFMWENSCGYLKKEDMQSIVTSGVGVWGPAMRVGTKSEICEITIDFK